MSAASGALEVPARYGLEEVTPRERTLCIRWRDGHLSEFHYIWLRHALFYPANTSADPSDETLRVPETPGTATITRIDSSAGSTLYIEWSDGTETEHDARWLREHCYSEPARAARKQCPLLWDAETAERLPWFDYRELDNDAAAFELLRAVRDYGFARLHHVPTVSGAIEQVAALFGPIRETNYGRIFDVRTDSRIRIGATTAKFLAPHTDENYRHAPPGISFFHCLDAHPDGQGQSTLTDGFLAAKRLAERDPDAFELLSRVPVGFRNTDPHEEDIRGYGRIICRDVDGEVVGIRSSLRPRAEPISRWRRPAPRILRSFAAGRPTSPSRGSISPIGKSAAIGDESCGHSCPSAL